MSSPGQQQRERKLQAAAAPRPRGSCSAEVVTNSMRCLRQKGSSFLRTHASKHGITNASRKLTGQVLQELTMHYTQVIRLPSFYYLSLLFLNVVEKNEKILYTSFILFSYTFIYFRCMVSRCTWTTLRALP